MSIYNKKVLDKHEELVEIWIMGEEDNKKVVIKELISLTPTEAALVAVQIHEELSYLVGGKEAAMFRGMLKVQAFKEKCRREREES